MTLHPGNLAGKPAFNPKPAKARKREGNAPRRTAIKAKPKRKTAADRAHIAAVKSLPCVICWAPAPSDAHHVICDRFSQKRAPDTMTIPLCKTCHQIGPLAIHNDKAGWISRNGKDHEYLPLVADMLAGEANTI